MEKERIKIYELVNECELYNSVMFRCNYCELQDYLKGYEPKYYYSNNLGWRFDVYYISDLNVHIITGYDTHIKGLGTLSIKTINVSECKKVINKVYYDELDANSLYDIITVAYYYFGDNK